MKFSECPNRAQTEQSHNEQADDDQTDDKIALFGVD
jgi:hypothetical protein